MAVHELKRSSDGRRLARVEDLTVSQQQFLSARLSTRTDLEACALVGVNPSRASQWKTEDPAFAAHYNALWTDAVDAAMAHSRQLLARATAVLGEGLDAETDAGKPDHRLRHEVAKTVLTIHGVLRQRVDIALVRQEAERLAREYALDPEELLAEAEQIARARALPPPSGDVMSGS